MDTQAYAALAQRLTEGAARALTGKEEETRLLLCALAAGGHVLLEDVPGTGKTALARALVEYLGGLNCVAMMTTHYDGVSDAARRHYQVAGLAALDTAAFRAGEAPLDRLSRLMD